MSFKHVPEALTLELPPPTKFVAIVMAWHACELCGMAWPGVHTLADETGLGPTRIRQALAELQSATWRGRPMLQERAYGQGGRGRSTQYIVLPGLIGLSTAPCAKCQWNLENPPRRDGNDKGRTDKPTAP